jgi:hypothetical protein
MLDNKILDFKNIIFIKAILFTIALVLLHILTNFLDNKVYRAEKAFMDNDISIQNISQRIKVLSSDKEKILVATTIFDEIIKNQLLKICIEKYNIISDINNIANNLKNLPILITANISQDISQFRYYNFNISNIANISSTMDFGVSDLEDINDVLKEILNNMPKNTRITSLDITEKEKYKLLNAPILFKIGDKSLFKVHTKLEYSKILM